MVRCNYERKRKKSKVDKDIEIPVDYSLENDPELRAKVMKAFASAKEGRVGSAEELIRKLFGPDETL